MRLRTISFFVCLATTASAEPTSLTGTYSAYEEGAIRAAEARLGRRRDPSPEGKTIERIDFVRLDPIEPRDPLPVALDVLHSTSREHVVRRNLLVAEGQPWRGVLVDESARNLRKLRQLSVVVCVPVTGSTPDRVQLLVITKDVWSLYVDFDLAMTSGGLESLTLEPKETNIAGLHHAALARFVLEPRTMTLGATYEIPRVEGRWLSVAVDANAVVNRDDGAIEGGYGSAKVQRPLFSSRTDWAWSTGTTFANRVRRRYVNAEVASFTPPDGGTPIPWSWRERSVVQNGKLTRSFGWAAKNDLSFGFSASHTQYMVDSPAAAASAFRAAAVPIGEDRVGPFVEWHAYRSDFLRTYDLAGLALQEDHRLGHDVQVRLYPVVGALGSTHDVLGAYAGASYGVALGDGLARGAVETTIEVQDREVRDGSVKGSFTIATPRFAHGRLLFAATALNRFANYLNAQSFLGGESLLRGYPTRYAVGKDLVTSNVEYRTASVDLAAVQVGAAAFYDVGDAFSGFDRIRPKQSVGGGLRIVFPQIDRSVLRLDVGVPLTDGPRPADVPPVSLFLAFHQAVGLPVVGGGLVP